MSAANVDHAAREALAECVSLERTLSGRSAGPNKARFAEPGEQTAHEGDGAAAAAGTVQGATSKELPPQH